MFPRPFCLRGCRQHWMVAVHELIDAGAWFFLHLGVLVSFGLLLIGFTSLFGDMPHFSYSKITVGGEVLLRKVSALAWVGSAMCIANTVFWMTGLKVRGWTESILSFRAVRNCRRMLSAVQKYIPSAYLRRDTMTQSCSNDFVIVVHLPVCLQFLHYLWGVSLQQAYVTSLKIWIRTMGPCVWKRMQGFRRIGLIGGKDWLNVGYNGFWWRGCPS